MGRSQRIRAGTAILLDKIVTPFIVDHGILDAGRAQFITLQKCRAPKFLVDPLEGPSMRRCRSGWNLGHDPDF